MDPNDDVITCSISIVECAFLFGNRSSYNALDSWRIFLYSVENAGCAVDGGVEKVSLDVGHVEMEGTRRVDDSFERGI